MERLSVVQLNNSLTLITTFMSVNKSKELKTFKELCEIFENCYEKWSNKDTSNDLRVLAYEKDMESGNWHGPIVLIRDTRLKFIVDGIHRGIAYLRCIKKGVNENALPEVYVIDNLTAFKSN